jgi:hypothetical protein
VIIFVNKRTYVVLTISLYATICAADPVWESALDLFMLPPLHSESSYLFSSPLSFGTSSCSSSSDDDSSYASDPESDEASLAKYIKKEHPESLPEHTPLYEHTMRLLHLPVPASSGLSPKKKNCVKK